LRLRGSILSALIWTGLSVSIPLSSFQISDRCLGQRMMGVIHEQALIIGHRPDDPELVFQLVPCSAVALHCPDAFCEAFGGASPNVGGVDTEFDFEMVQQGRVGSRVDAHLEITQIQRNSIGNLVTEGTP